MMTKFLMIFSLLIAALLGGCGSQPAANETAAKNGAASSPASSPGAGQPGGDPSSPSGISVATSNSNIDPNAPAAGEVAMSNKRGVVDGPSGPPLKNPVKDAPENSTVSTTMGKNGAFIETRAFTADPAVAKVERTTLGPDKRVKVFLKNGRVVTVPSDKIGSINTVTLATIRQLAGVKPPAAPPADTRTDDTKKKP